MITNDTGQMHRGYRARQSLLALFGPTEPRRTGPYRQLNSVMRMNMPCSPCLKSRCTYEKPNECLKALSPAIVFEVRMQKI